MTPAARPKPNVRVFVSYSSKDSDLARLLTQKIEGDGITCFYAGSDIKDREVWPDRLDREIEQANVVLLLYSHSAAVSDWVYKEIETAYRLGTDIWMLRDRGVNLTSRFAKFGIEDRYQAFLFEQGTETAAFDSLKRELNKYFGRTDRPVRGVIDPNLNPYPGTPYTFADRDFFFGRDAECNKLELALKDSKERIFFVYGPSGAGKSSLIDAGLRRQLDKSWWFSRKIEPALASPQTMAVDMWRYAERELRSDGASPDAADSRLFSDILSGIEKLNRPRYLFWFDHLERLLLLEDPELIVMFFRHAGELMRDDARVRILLSFREEMLSRAEKYTELLPEGSWKKWYVRRLGREGALDSIILPAKVKNGVTVHFNLASAIVDQLARSEFEDLEGRRIVTVNPVSLQLVCRRLWAQGKPGLPSISSADLPRTGQGLEADVKHFVEGALENHLNSAIEKIARNLKGGDLDQRRELIRLGLLQFVSEDRRRQQLKEEPDGKGTRVGRLQLEIVNQLYEEKLLQHTDIGLRMSDYRYELVHDSLAEAIDHFRKNLDLLRTLNTLESLVRKEWHEGKEEAVGSRPPADDHRQKAGFPAGYFNHHSDLLAELEPSRCEETGFSDREKEFLFRCALGNRRKLAKTQISLEGWAMLLAEVEADRSGLVRVLKDALSPQCGDDSVRRDAIGLLMQQPFRALLSPAQLKDLGTDVRNAALRGSPEVQEAAAVALCEIGEPPGGGELFAAMEDGDERSQARRAVSYIRHAADRRELRGPEACAGFESRWRAAGFVDRVSILGRLWWRRLVGSLGWMFFTVVVATVFTSIGAALAFVPMGLVGASLTLADKNAGWAKGPFHGVVGGAFWAIGISTSLICYWVILKGGRPSPKIRKWIPAALAASVGGFLGGIALALVIGFVFQQESLYSAGWLLTRLPGRSRLAEIFWQTRHGWWTPILGAAVAVGISWSLQTFSADPKAEEFLRRHSDASQKKRASFAIFKILKVVTLKSWRILGTVSLGGLLVLFLLRPGPGICDAGNPGFASGNPPCKMEYALAPLPARVAGIVFIIWTGGIFMELGILFGIFVARAGVTLECDETFLQPFKD